MQMKADLETLTRSVTNKVTHTKLTQNLEFPQYFKQWYNNALNTKRPQLGGAVTYV